MASLAQTSISDDDIDTRVRGFGDSVKRQALRLGQKAGAFSFLAILLDGVPPVIARDDARSAFSGQGAITPPSPVQNEITAETCEKGAVMEAAVAMCRIGQPASEVDCPKTKPLGEATHRTTHETGVRPDVGTNNRIYPSSSAFSTKNGVKTAASKVHLFSRANRVAEQQGLSTVSAVAQSSVPVRRQRAPPLNEVNTPRTIKADNESGPVRNVQSSAKGKRQRRLLYLASKHSVQPRLATAASGTVTSATQHIHQNRLVSAGSAEVFMGAQPQLPVRFAWDFGDHRLPERRLGHFSAN
ncbi:unnamed protein product [Colletotrichum noveboracense]|uniref:Uncharacterized protein n=1 Tax=Colletotrichum noveboracense TaxID=2664923 RepID=A0A9W4WHE3_9PEZI|nr:unnamed protein product [Colletotrichum noveboracense]